ncbi:MAG: hypothetical protein QF721_04655, partial [Verrucomicrobiota bacterium]|nr:hypothetical protein [Verrucomicrobiota bacterium]
RGGSGLALILACAFPGTVFSQSGEEPGGAWAGAAAKVSVYDRDALSILIEAPAGVKMEVQGSANLVDWKRLAELMAGDKPLIWNPPGTLEGPALFFRVKPMGGPDEVLGGGDAEDGDDGGENPGGPDVEKPDSNEPFDPGDPDGGGPMDRFTEIDPDSDLAKRLAKLVMGGLDEKGLTFGSIVAVDEVTDDEGEFYFVHLEVLNGEGDQLEVFVEVEADEQGALKLVHADTFDDGDPFDPFGPDDPDDGIDAIEHVDPESELGQALIEAALAHVDGEGYESVEVVSVDRFNDGDRDMFGVVLLVNGDGQVMTLFLELEREVNGNFKVHEVEDDPFDPNDPDGGMGNVEPIDPESKLGQAILKAAVARLEDAGLKLSEVLVMDRVTTNVQQSIELILVAKDAEGHELTVFAEVAETADGGFDILDIDISKPVDPDDPVFGGKTEELDPESDLVHKLAALALEHADAEGLELDRVTGALRLSFGAEETVYLIDFLVKNSDGDVQKAFAEIMETADGQYEVGHVGIGDDGNWPEPQPEPWPEPHGIIVPPEGSRSHFIDPQGDLASALVTIVHLSIGDHVKTPWEIEHVEEAVRWHVPGEGARFVLLAKGADANGKSGHLLAVLMRKDGSLTIEFTDVRTGINPDEPIEFPLPPEEGG